MEKCLKTSRKMKFSKLENIQSNKRQKREMEKARKQKWPQKTKSKTEDYIWVYSSLH